MLPYMSRQPHLKPIMRAILVDWLLDVGVLYHTLDSTLHLAVSCVDRFLQRRTITRDKFQLIGTAAMLIAMCVWLAACAAWRMLLTPPHLLSLLPLPFRVRDAKEA